MPPMGPAGRRGEFKKPRDTKKTVSKILHYIGKNKALLLVVLFMLVLTTLCSTGASYWLKPILNDVEASIIAGNFATVGVKELAKNLAIVASFYVGASLFSFFQSRIMVSVSFKTTNLIRKDLFDHLQTLPLRFFDAKTHGELMSRFTNDVDNIQMMLEQTIVQLFSSVFTFVSIVTMMIVLEWKLFIVAAVFLVIMIANSAKGARRDERKYRGNNRGHEGN